LQKSNCIIICSDHLYDAQFELDKSKFDMNLHSIAGYTVSIHHSYIYSLFPITKDEVSIDKISTIRGKGRINLDILSICST